LLRGWTDTTTHAESIKPPWCRASCSHPKLARIIDGKRQLLLGLSKIRSVRGTKSALQQFAERGP